MARPLRKKTTMLLSGLVALALWWPGCGDDEPAGPELHGEPPPSGPDTLPPAAIDQLICRSPGAGSLALQWIAPGDDGWEGTAVAYDIRYSKSGITAASWHQAVQFPAAPAPQDGGTIQVCRVSGLESSQFYYFAIKTRDEAGNESEISNVASDTTAQEQSPPASVTDLTATAVDSVTFLLEWTAPGDNGVFGTASQYDVRYALRAGVDDSNWNAANEADGEPAPSPSGQQESMLVTVPEINANYGFALKTADEVPLWSEISNVCLALGKDSHLWVYPLYLRKGRILTIIFRSPGNSHVVVELHRLYAGYGCGQGTITLVDGHPPEGTYTISYDFYIPEQQAYHPPDWYHVFVCADGVRVGEAKIEFVD